MLWRFALDPLHNLLSGMPTPFDLHIDSNDYVRLFLVYMMQMDHFFPVTDAWIPIAGLWFTIHVVFGTVKIVEVVVNVIRGAGVRLLG